MGDSTTTVARTDDETPQERSGEPAQSHGTDSPTVELHVPAESSYVSLLRTTTAALAARMSFTIDDIEDLRIAVDEACAMLLASARPGAVLTCTFELLPDTLEIRVAVPSHSDAAPRRNSFGWTVLSALAGGADAGSENGTSWISLHKQRDTQGS